MKRNESILVYSVTGLLVVILAVAILFGNENNARAHESGKGFDDLESLSASADKGAGVGAADKPADGKGAAPEADDELVTPPTKAGGANPPPPEAAGAKSEVPAGAGQPAPEAAGAAKADAEKPPAPLVAVPLVTPGIKPAADTESATQALVLLGDSKRDGQYRIVTVRRGDTFSELVQRWCGSLESLPLAESLNEEANLGNLKEGTKLCMPWVEDATLVAAHHARRTKVESETKVLSEARASGRTHTIKAGDKLWNIAVAQVGQKDAAKYIERIKALNSELLAHPDRLVVGKTILLPER